MIPQCSAVHADFISCIDKYLSHSLDFSSGPRNIVDVLRDILKAYGVGYSEGV